MRKLLILSFVVLMTASLANAGNMTGMNPTLPIVSDSGGPDNYGYSWEDNDNHGTVPYSWYEISTIGTEVTGLLDDNNIGPIQLGFEFPYYWYQVTRLWIGSNGYTSFSSNANFAHPFQNIPYVGQPNDLLAVCTGDLTFVTSGGIPLPNAKCYYWTNNTDSFVVQWSSVGEFGYNDSTHTFQMVLDATDSSITFYYGQQYGRFLDSNGTTKDVIGIENVTGTVGLQYLRDNLPADRMFHDGLALRFHAIPDSSFEAHDVGVLNVFNGQNGAKIHAVGFESIIQGEVKNFGNRDETGFNVTCEVRDPSNTIVQRDTITVNETIPASSSLWVSFDPFTPTVAGQYRVDMRTYLANDVVASNNSHRGELRAVPFAADTPVDILYDDDAGEIGRSWNGDFSGFGNEFESPYLPMNVNNVQTNIFAVTAPGNLHVWLMDDDGTGNPGDILVADTVAVSAVGWDTTDFSSANIVINQGKVFAVAIVELQASGIQIGTDQSTTTPFSFRGWEYTGGLAGDRDRELSDVMIRINAMAIPTAVYDPTDENLPARVSLEQNYPNPFNPTTNIDYSVPVNSNVKLDIFNIMGQKVKTLINGNAVAGRHNIVWDGSADDGSQISSGVYFYRLSVGDETFIRRMTLVK